MTDRPLASRVLFVHDLEADATVHARIRAEYREMPGMRLTIAQAARLFGLERSSCEQVLKTLVVAGELWTDGRQFLRSNAGKRIV